MAILSGQLFDIGYGTFNAVNLSSSGSLESPSGIGLGNFLDISANLIFTTLNGEFPGFGLAENPGLIFTTLNGEFPGFSLWVEAGASLVFGEIKALFGIPNDAITLVQPNDLLAGFTVSLEAKAINSGAIYTQHPWGYYLQYLSSFERFFGIGSTQDATKIYIKKAALPRLTPLANNKAETLLAALLARLYEAESNYLVSKVMVSFYKKELIVLNSVLIERVTFEVKMFSLYANRLHPSSTKALTPNDY
jgi:hypothetical protein